MKKRSLRLEDIKFDQHDQILHIDKKHYKQLSNGEFFRTSGCHGCNRPFYNEKVSELWYNFPRNPKDEEIKNSLKITKDLFI